MSKRRIEVFTVAILAALLLAMLPAPANADGVTLALSPAAGSPGSTITIDGTITNNTANTVYLNGEDFSFGTSSFLNGDTTDFFLNAPFLLEAGDTSGLISLFTLDIAPGIPGGAYEGNFLDILGGTDSSDDTDVLASSEFPINVAAVATPEPSAIILLGTGLLLLAGLRRRWGRRGASSGTWA